MKALKNCVRLGSTVKIYVPSTLNIDQKADNSKWVDATLEFLATEYGGATATKALGAWVSADIGLVKEGITLVMAYTNSNTLEATIERVYDYCVSMKLSLTQEAIALEVNGEMYFV